MKYLAVLALLALTGCLCLRAAREPALGPCSDYDLNNDGMIGSGDWSVLRKNSPVYVSDVVGIKYYYGQKCPGPEPHHPKS